LALEMKTLSIIATRRTHHTCAEAVTAEFPLTSERIPVAYEPVQNPSDLMIVLTTISQSDACKCWKCFVEN